MAARPVGTRRNTLHMPGFILFISSTKSSNSPSVLLVMVVLICKCMPASFAISAARRVRSYVWGTPRKASWVLSCAPSRLNDMLWTPASFNARKSVCSSRAVAAGLNATCSPLPEAARTNSRISGLMTGSPPVSTSNGRPQFRQLVNQAQCLLMSQFIRVRTRLGDSAAMPARKRASARHFPEDQEGAFIEICFTENRAHFQDSQFRTIIIF